MGLNDREDSGMARFVSLLSQRVAVNLGEHLNSYRPVQGFGGLEFSDRSTPWNFRYPFTSNNVVYITSKTRTEGLSIIIRKYFYKFISLRERSNFRGCNEEEEMRRIWSSILKIVHALQRFSVSLFRKFRNAEAILIGEEVRKKGERVTVDREGGNGGEGRRTAAGYKGIRWTFAAE